MRVCVSIRTPRAAQRHFGHSHVQQSHTQRGGDRVAGGERGSRRRSRRRVHRLFPGAHVAVTETGEEGQEQPFGGGAGSAEDRPTGLVPQHHPGPRGQESHRREADPH